MCTFLQTWEVGNWSMQTVTAPCISTVWTRWWTSAAAWQIWKKWTAKSMYCNLDTSWRKVATFRVWGKRPGYPVHGWLGSAETQAPSGKQAGWGLKSPCREYQRETTSNCSLEWKVCCAESSLFSDWAIKTQAGPKHMRCIQKGDYIQNTFNYHNREMI